MCCGGIRGCCTFNSSLAIWSGEKEGRGVRGAGLEKLCAPPPSSSPPSSSFFVMAPGRTCGGGGGRGRRGAEGLICILLPFACWPGIKPCAGQESHQTYALLFREKQRERETETLASALSIKWENKLSFSPTGINSLIFPLGISFTSHRGSCCRGLLFLFFRASYGKIEAQKGNFTSKSLHLDCELF